MLEAAHVAPERIRPLRRTEYDRLVELGLFEDERVELLEGVLVEMSPQGARHAEVVTRLAEALSASLRGRARLRLQAPIALSEASEPEPDVALVRPGDYSERHPGTALLVVEVAQTSSRKDRGLKARLYAAAGIAEYWLVDLTADVVEVRRAPKRGRYTSLKRLRAGSVAPLALPEAAVDVAALLR